LPGFLPKPAVEHPLRRVFCLQIDNAWNVYKDTVMKRSSEKLVSEILSLPAQSRAYVAEKLIESLDVQTDAELDASWKNEVLKRCREIDEGHVELTPSDKAITQVLSAIA